MNEQFLNAKEKWTLYDSIMVMSNVDSLYAGSGWFNQYSDLSAPAELPFFNVRNKSVGNAYCNFDSANKIPYPFHIQSIGITFSCPAISTAASEPAPSAPFVTRESDAFFANELPKHSAVILKVSQDEKLVQASNLMPSGQGPSGWSYDTFPDATAATSAITNLNNGSVMQSNRWEFPEPISVPKDRNVEAQLVISPYARNVLAKMAGPAWWPGSDESNYPNKYPAAAVIRLSMYGIREVQQRNNLHF